MEPPEPCFIVLLFYHENRPEAADMKECEKEKRFWLLRSQIKNIFHLNGV